MLTNRLAFAFIPFSIARIVITLERPLLVFSGLLKTDRMHRRLVAKSLRRLPAHKNSLAGFLAQVTGIFRMIYEIVIAIFLSSTSRSRYNSASVYFGSEIGMKAQRF
jgi:hypothetical protein